MKDKPLKLDWDQLEEAFSRQNDELSYYLDLVTGHLVLEGEGEDAAADDDDTYGGGVTATAPPARNDATRAYVKPPDLARKIEWMKEFIKSKELDAETAAELKEALKEDDPTAAIKAVLARHAEFRDSWYLYRSDRLHEMINDWLTEHEVAATEPPPWKA